MGEVARGIIASVLSAILLSLVFFFWNDFVYRKDSLTGYWKAEAEVTKSSYNPYVGLRTEYHLLLVQTGNVVTGTGEKVLEITKKGLNEYDHEDRPQITLDGGVTYKFFSPSSVHLRYTEDGSRRKSSTLLDLTIESGNTVSGNFMSTIAASSGTVRLTRTQVFSE
jgi:hypothetical protein